MKNRYAVGGTSHIFYDHGPEEQVRFSFDYLEGCFLQAQLSKRGAWVDVGATGEADLKEWITQFTPEELAIELGEYVEIGDVAEVFA